MKKLIFKFIWKTGSINSNLERECMDKNIAFHYNHFGEFEISKNFVDYRKAIIELDNDIEEVCIVNVFVQA